MAFISLKDYLNENKNALMNEAFFAEKNIDKVLRLYGKILTRKFGANFIKFGSETFTKSDGSKGNGVRYINSSGFQIRWNFEKKDMGFFNKQKSIDGKQLYISSLDFWNNQNKDFAKPSLTVNLPKELNVIQILEKLCDMLRTGKIGSFKAKNLKSSTIRESIFEATSDDVEKGEMADFLIKRGMNKSQAQYQTSKKAFDNMLRNDPGMQAEFDEYVIEIKAGKPESNSLDSEFKEAQKKSVEIQYCDPDVVFNDIEKMTTFTAVGGTKSLIVCGMAGVGKCIDVDTQIATPSGSLRAGDIKIGDEILTPKNTSAKVLKVYPQNEQKECYEVILNDGRSVIADKEQLFKVKITNLKSGSNHNNYKILPLNEIIQTFNEQKEQLKNEGKWDCKNPKRPHIFFPDCEAIEYNPKETPIDPYFLGLLLGDGGISQDTITFTNNSEKTINWVKDHLNNNYNDYSLVESKDTHYRIVRENIIRKGVNKEDNKNILKEKLKSLNLMGLTSHYKFIPENYIFNSIETRLELIRGLMDTDGYIGKNGNSSYCTVSETLANDFIRIIRSLGGRAKKTIKSIKYLDSYKNAFEISFTLPFKIGMIVKNNELKVERYSKRLQGKESYQKLLIDDIKPVGLRDTICFLIDDEEHLFLTEDYMIVHNTYHIQKALEELEKRDNIEWYYHSAMKMSPFSLYKTVFMERKGVIVFDEADSILSNSDMVVQLKSALDTSGKNTFEYAYGTKNVKGMSDDEIKKLCNQIEDEVSSGEKIIGVVDKGKNVMLPSKFFFEGKMVLISNMPSSKIDSAVLSRSIFIDVELKPEDKLRRIESILVAQGNDIKTVEEVVEALGKNKKGSKELTVRSAVMAIRMKNMGYDDWARLASLYA